MTTSNTDTESSSEETQPDPQHVAISRLLVLTVALQGLLGAFSRAARTANAAEALHDAEYIRSGRIREQCVADLRSQGVVASRAEKEASDHPIYTSYKDNLAKLADAKRDAALDRDVAFEQLECGKLELAAHTAIVTALSAGGDHLIMMSRPEDSANDIVRKLRDAARSAHGVNADLEKVPPGTPDARD